jgi:hypothetical protein
MMGTGTPVFAQGDVNEEVKRAVERAVGASVSSSVAESLSRSIVSDALRTMPADTVFLSPFYNRINGDISLATFTADTFGGVVGGLHKFNDYFLLHGAFSGAHTHVKAKSDGNKTSANARFIQGLLGGDLVFLNTEPAKSWFTLEGAISNFDSDAKGVDSTWAWSILPSATVSLRAGPVLFEPRIGFSFSNTFDHDSGGDNDTVIQLQTGFSLKYRGEKFRPQLNFSYSKVIQPNIDDNGFISVGPEILYAITPSILIGGAYSYGTPLTKDVSIHSHTVTLEFRWTF